MPPYRASQIVRQLALPISCLAAFLSAGCYAGIRAGEVKPDATTAVRGVRYNLPAPYLVVERTAKGQVDAKIHYLADRKRTFYVHPIVILATQTAEIELNADGTLKSFKLEQDATPVSAAIVQGIKDISIKKLDLEKSEAEERAKQGAGASQAPDEKNSTIWIFALKGSKAELLQDVSLAVPPASGGAGGSPAGKLEGTFSVTLGSAKPQSGEQKLVALRRPEKADVSISHPDHKFTKDDLGSKVTLEGISSGAVQVDGEGHLIVKEADIPADGAKLKFGNEEVTLKRQR